MSRLALAAALMLAVVACSTKTLEEECIDLCDRAERCVEEYDQARFDTCAEGCRAASEEGMAFVADGTITQACFDTNTDVLSCFNRLDCLELQMSLTSTPARCRDEFRTREEICSE
ncbi:MAG: hypothetical protein RMA76_06130 [Deltaproteobacteria bacterium]|jgi:hypothetical protein